MGRKEFEMEGGKCIGAPAWQREEEPSGADGGSSGEGGGLIARGRGIEM